jgi:ankyrin repeat protein
MDQFPANAFDITTIKQLIESGTDINKKYENDTTLLLMAIFWNQIDIVKYLVESGANINDTWQFGYSPLHLAIMFKKLPHSPNNDIIYYLLENGASKDYTNELGKNAVDVALGYGDDELAQYIGCLQLKSYEATPDECFVYDDPGKKIVINIEL